MTHELHDFFLSWDRGPHRRCHGHAEQDRQGRPFENHASFQGTVFPVNPKHTELLAGAASATVMTIPGKIDSPLSSYRQPSQSR